MRDVYLGALDNEIFEVSKKYGQKHRQELATFQDNSHQISIQMMTILPSQDHYFSNASHQVESKERRMPQNVLRLTTNPKKGKAHQQTVHKITGNTGSLCVSQW